MKPIFTYLIILSICLNILFAARKIQRVERVNEEMKLHHYKNISHQEGFGYFLDQMKKNYPETNITQKHFIVYRWDSTLYDFIYRDQMRALDSMAAAGKKNGFEFILVTEMEETASKRFLKWNHDAYNNAKMLFGMDDFISGLHHVKGMKLQQPIIVGGDPAENKKLNFKQSSFYVIMDSKGTVLHSNGYRAGILKDTSFLNKLKMLMDENNLKVLN